MTKLKKAMQSVYSQLDQVGGRISELKDKHLKLLNQGSRKNKDEESLQELWDIINRPNLLHNWHYRKRKKRYRARKKILEK